MNKYDVFIDVSNDWQENNIEVVQTTVKANNTKEANKKHYNVVLKR